MKKKIKEMNFLSDLKKSFEDIPLILTVFLKDKVENGPLEFFFGIVKVFIIVFFIQMAQVYLDNTSGLDRPFSGIPSGSKSIYDIISIFFLDIILVILIICTHLFCEYHFKRFGIFKK